MSTLDLIFEKRYEIREIVNSCYFTNPRVFGSVAREEDTEESDIDILLDPTEKATGWKLARVKRQLEKLLGKKVDVAIDRSLHEIFRPQIEKDLKEI